MALPSGTLMDFQRRCFAEGRNVAESPGTVWTEYSPSRGEGKSGETGNLNAWSALYFRLEQVG
jgi:hypothetical protein